MQRSAPRLAPKHMAGIVWLCKEAGTIQSIKSALVKGWTVAGEAFSSAAEQPEEERESKRTRTNASIMWKLT